MTEEIIIDGVNVAGCEYIEAPKGKENAVCSCIDIRNCEGDIDLLLTYCEDNPDCYYKLLQRLKKTLKHIDNGRKEKANKLKRIEEIVTHCIQGGFTDEFIQEIFDICREYEEV